MSSVLSRSVREISCEGFDMLPGMPAKRKRSKKKPRQKSKQYEQSDYQKYLESLVDASGLTDVQFEEESERLGRRIPASSLRSTLRTTSTLSFKVIEYIALTCLKNPIDVMRRGLDNPPDEEEIRDFEGSPIEKAWDLYKTLDPEEQERIERYRLKPLIDEMQEIRLKRR